MLWINSVVSNYAEVQTGMAQGNLLPRQNFTLPPRPDYPLPPELVWLNIQE